MRTTASASTATSDAEFRLIADSLAHIVWTAAPDGSTEYFNRQAATYCGSRTGVSSGWEWQSLVHPDDVDEVRAAWDLAIRTHAPFVHDLRLRRIDREFRWHAFRCLPVRNQHGAMQKWVCSATDIHATKELEGDLRLAEHNSAEALRLLERLQSDAPVETEQVAERVLLALSLPLHMGNQEMHVTASLGIALADEHATPESLLRDSDSAMYRAKERGRGRIEMFDEALRLNARRRLATASALHRALEREEFVVHYQPVVDLTSGAMVSAEALVRWRHPEHGMVTPDEFISLAEETGLIVPIGARVLQQACQDLADWQSIEASSGSAATLSVAVNLSVRQMLAPGIAGLVADVLSRSGVRPGDLCLELTESVFMEDVDYFARTLASLKEIGVQLSIDDFGTGYSSLSYLKRFPVDGVKVDRVFVDGLGTDPHDTALVAAIVAMGSALDLQVTAEGVETHEQLLGLKSLRVPRAQGYFLDRPMSAEEISRRVAEVAPMERHLGLLLSL